MWNRLRMRTPKAKQNKDRYVKNDFIKKKGDFLKRYGIGKMKVLNYINKSVKMDGKK